VLFDKIVSVYILFEKYIYILALEMASPVNQRCTKCIGTLSFHMGQTGRGFQPLSRCEVGGQIFLTPTFWSLGDKILLR